MPYEDSVGTGETGEGSFSGSPGETSEFYSTPIPGGSPTAPTGQSPRPQEGGYSSGGFGSNSAGYIRGEQILVGTDPFGNPLYQFRPYPVARAYYELNPGWNTRATIPEPIGPTMYLSYKAGASVGAVVGLTDQPETQAGYEDIILGYMTLRGVAYIISRGVVLAEIPTATTLPDPGKYNRDVDALTIKKTVNRVEFFLTSATGQGGEIKVGEAFMSEPVTYVSAALYLGGDTINSEILEYPEVVAGEFPALIGGIYESASATYVMGEFPALTGSVFENDNSVISSSFQALGGFIGENANSFIRSDFPALSGNLMSASDATIVPDFNFTFAEIPPVIGAMMVRDVTFGTIGGSLPALSGFSADEDVTLIRGTLPAVRGGMWESEFPDRFTFVSFAYASARMIARPTAYVVFNSRAEVVAAFTLDEIAYMLLESEATGNGTATLAEIIYQVLTSTMSAGDVASLQRDGMSVWALHMDSMGSTRYEGYDFNSFMTIDGKTYGVNATGIHRLEGTTDDGARIPASVDFGSLSFGTNNRKALPYVYVGMSSSGKTVLKVESDGGTYYYTARDSTALMKAHRFEPGRGLRSTFYGLSLQTDGEAFDLHNIDFQPVELKRSL